jgi:uncharacterized integral membrane protein
VRKPKTIAIVVVFVLFLIFLYQNRADITLHLYFWPVTMSQIILVPLILLVGFACGFAVGKLTGRKKPAKNQTVSQVS